MKLLVKHALYIALLVLLVQPQSVTHVPFFEINVTVISYVMKYHNMTLNEAYKFVHAKRDVIGPNRGFCMQLWDYERQLLGENEVKMNRFDDKHPEWYWNKV